MYETTRDKFIRINVNVEVTKDGLKTEPVYIHKLDSLVEEPPYVFITRQDGTKYTYKEHNGTSYNLISTSKKDRNE